MTKLQDSLRAAWFAVGVLTLANISSFIDRQILALLVKPIKRDLHLSDIEMSLLMGLSFAIFYTFFGILIGRQADRNSRKRIIIWGVAVWSLMTTLCAGVGNYFQFFLARMGVGVGESTLSPSANSMIGDLFPKDKLATATSVFTLGVFLGTGLATLIGAGIVSKLPTEGMVTIPIFGEVFPWQLIFLYIGIPGLLVVLLLFFITEPRRKNTVQLAGKDAKLSLRESIAIIFTHKSAYLFICMSIACQAMINYGMNTWVPTFINRTFDWPVPKAGLYFGLVSCISAISGALTGGSLSDKWVKSGNPGGRLKVGTIGLFLGLLGFVAPLCTVPACSILLFALPIFGLAMPFGAGMAAINEIMPNQVRAQAISILLFIINLLGMGLGPFMVAFMTDKVFGNESMIKYSLMILFLIGGVLGLIMNQLAIKHYQIALNKITHIEK